jgi:predicted  nucleic acid-binding Zn-ribbon protein
MLKKMYIKEASIVTENSQPIVREQDDKKRIKTLEDEVRQLKEQIHKLSNAQQLSSRQIRRQNTDINNVTTAIRNR